MTVQIRTCPQRCGGHMVRMPGYSQWWKCEWCGHQDRTPKGWIG